MAKGFIAIAAMSENGVIGAGGKIPWHIPDEFKWFKQTTMGHTLVMGRKTFDSIGRPLPGRRTIVLSRSPLTIPGVTVVPSLDQLDPAQIEGPVFIAGGAEIYRQALPRISEIYLTVVKKTVEGDTFFPKIDEFFERAETLLDHPEFTVYRYRQIEENDQGASPPRFYLSPLLLLFGPLLLIIISWIVLILFPLFSKLFHSH